VRLSNAGLLAISGKDHSNADQMAEGGHIRRILTAFVITAFAVGSCLGGTGNEHERN
jgi:hypothetical protein